MQNASHAILKSLYILRKIGEWHRFDASLETCSVGGLPNARFDSISDHHDPLWKVRSNPRGQVVDALFVALLPLAFQQVIHRKGNQVVKEIAIAPELGQEAVGRLKSYSHLSVKFRVP
jgi:hypothetical protein